MLHHRNITLSQRQQNTMPNNTNTRQRANNSNPAPAAATPAGNGEFTTKIVSVSADKSGGNGVFFEIDTPIIQLEEGTEIQVTSFSKSRETLLKELNEVEAIEEVDVCCEGAPTLFEGFTGCLIPILKGREITFKRTLKQKGDVVNGFPIEEPVYVTELTPTKKQIKAINEGLNVRLFDKAVSRLVKKSFDF